MSSDQADARPCSESQPQAEGITNAPPSDPTTTQDPDVEAAGSVPTGSLAPAPTPAAAPVPALDIEHQLVDDDLQLWSSHQKAICVATLMLGALSPTLGASIFLPAFQSTQVQLNAFNATISLAVSLWHRSPFLALHIRAHRKEVDIHCGIDHLRGNLSHLRSFELGRSIRDHALHFSHRPQPHAQQEASTKSASAHNSESTPANSTIIPAFLASSPHTMPLLDDIITLLWCLAESSSESMLSQLDGVHLHFGVSPSPSPSPSPTSQSHVPRPTSQSQALSISLPRAQLVGLIPREVLVPFLWPSLVGLVPRKGPSRRADPVTAQARWTVPPQRAQAQSQSQSQFRHG